MAKAKVLDYMKDPKIDTLEAENAVLRKKVEDAEKLAETMSKLGGTDVMSEVGKIRAKGKSSPGNIVVKTGTDHKNITLWTEGGKPVGPMHPDNAINALQIFAAKGIRLLTDKPTGEQQEEYHKSPAGKALFDRTNKSRAIKDKTRKSSVMERLAAEIAKQTGTTTAAINRLLQAHEVRGN